MKFNEVAFRDHVYFHGKKSYSGPIELHPVGVLIQEEGRKRVLVPFSNVLWIGVEAEPALAPKKP